MSGNNGKSKGDLENLKTMKVGDLMGWKNPDDKDGDGFDDKYEREAAPDLEYDTLEELREARKKLTFRQKLKRTWQGKTKVGKFAGTVLDVTELFAPKWAVKTRDIIQSKQTRKPMLQKISSVKNFVNLKDENGNFSWEELAASVLQLVLAGAIVWGAQKLGLPLDKIISAITGG